MLKRINKNNDVVLDYIGNNYNRCLYLYLDYLQYGFSNPNVLMWSQEFDGKVVALVLLYYTGMHIFTRDYNCNYKEIANLVKEKKPSIVCSEKIVISNLEPFLGEYLPEYGFVREMDCIDNKFYSNDVINASVDDFPEIAKLICSDYEFGAIYNVDDLANQLRERNESGYCRNYIIKKDNKIVSHVATGAECDSFAIISYVITDSDFRGQGYALKTVGTLCNDLLNENKKVFLINYTSESTALYTKLGFKESCQCGKLFINK